MNKYIFPLLLILCLLGCSRSKNASKHQVLHRIFTIIFNGKDFTHWDNREGHWWIEDSSIVSGNLEILAEKMSWLYTIKSYSDFELHLDAKIIGDNHRNSGIWYRATPFLFSGHEEEGDEISNETGRGSSNR